MVTSACEGGKCVEETVREGDEGEGDDIGAEELWIRAGDHAFTHASKKKRER